MPHIAIAENLYLVGSGDLALSHYLDSHIWLVGDQDEWALVDAGAGIGTEQVVETVQSLVGRHGQLRYILLTHCHGDHAGGVHLIKEATGAKVVASAFEHRMLESGSDYDIGLAQAKFSGSYPQDYVFTHAQGDMVVGHGDTLALGRLRITALFTPGHTKGSVCFLVAGRGPRVLFSGDTVFWGGLIALLNTPGSEISDYREGVKVLAGLKVDCLCPAHGLWAMRRGQMHIDKCLSYFLGSGIPPMPPRIEKVKHG